MLNARSALQWLEEGGRRRSLRPGDRAHRRSRTRRSSSASTRPASCPSPKASAAAIRSGRRSASRPRSRSAGTRSKACSKARRRWTAISASRRSRPMRRCSPPSSTAITPMSAAPRPARSSPMTNGCGCCPSYLQQLEMELNGKSVRSTARRSAAPPRRSSGAGSAPTPSTPSSNCSTRARISCPVEFVAAIEPGDSLDPEAITAQLLAQLLRPGRGADGRPRRRTIRTASIPATGPRRRSCSTGSTRRRSAR